MSDVKGLIAEIREYEYKSEHSKRTNEKELPNLKFLVSNIDQYGFGKEDLDLKQRLMVVADRIEKLEVVGITEQVLDECRKEVADILKIILQRYKDRIV